MTLHKTSVSMIAALAVTGGAAYAQSGDSSSFCDAGYMSADTNSDGMIDKEELAKVTEAEFSSLDANDDGTVTMAEYSDCRGSWTKMASNSSTLTDSDVSALDTNQDGNIDQSEYMEKADQEYTSRWSATGAENQKEVRDADFAPATPDDEEGDGSSDSASAGQSDGNMPSDTEGSAQTAEASQSDGNMPTDADSSAQTAEAGKSDEMLQSEPKLILRRIIFMPNDQRAISDMSRDEVAQRSAQMFMLLDTDRNKMIDSTEQKGQSEVQASMDDMLSEQFNRADADSSGDLSKEEYAADMQARWQQAQERQQNANPDVGAPVVYFHYPHPM